MNIEKMKIFLDENNHPKFRFDQIIKAVYQDGILNFSEITNLSKNLREELAQNFSILSFKAQKVLISRKSDSVKALLELEDGNLLETVLISPKEGVWSACISSQVGCPLACAFCATGKGGFKRNLTAEEISDQVLFWKQYLRKNNISGNFSNIVYMGMGEPFLNFKEMEKSLRIITDPKLLGFGARSVSVSTAGVMEKLEEFSRLFPQVNIAISLHSANEEKRSKLMPVNRKFSLEVIKDGLQKYFVQHKRKVFLEYLLIDRFNYSEKDAFELADFIKSIGLKQLLHVNLIRYNITGDEFRPSRPEKARLFKEFLVQKGVSVTIRKSLGEEIQGACGQLAGKK